MTSISEFYAHEQAKVAHKDEQIAFLWDLLDAISTAGDAFKPELTAYFKYVNEKCDERSKVANSPDGQILEIMEYDD